MEGKVFVSKRKRGGPRIRVVEWYGNRGKVVNADSGLKPRSIELGTLRENYREDRDVLVEITTDPSDAPADFREEVLP